MIIDLNEFQSWAFGDALDNTFRGIVGEFIVLKAVESQAIYRLNWDGYDIKMTDGTKIEVKVSGYVQSWNQGKMSVIGFDIKEKDPWIASEARYLGQKCRYADIWVFAIHREKDRVVANPFDTDQWEFLATSTKWLYEVFGKQESVRYSVLKSKGLKPVEYSSLGREIEKVKSSIHEG